MKAIVTILFACSLALCSCSKIIENKQKNIVLELMTNGQWYVQSYMHDSSSVTAEFDGYLFQFHENGMVEGKKGGLVTEGTWIADVPNLSIISEFPGAGEPLKRLNGTWLFKDTSETYVLAEMTTAEGKMVLKLKKQV